VRDERKNRGDRFDVSFFVSHSSGFTQVTRNRTVGGEQSIREQRWEGVTAKGTNQHQTHQASMHPFATLHSGKTPKQVEQSRVKL
jgi:hypothetical protein